MNDLRIILQSWITHYEMHNVSTLFVADRGKVGHPLCFGNRTWSCVFIVKHTLDMYSRLHDGLYFIARS